MQRVAVVVGAILAVLAGQIREANARAERAEQAQAKATADATRQFEAARQEFTQAQAEANVRADRTGPMGFDPFEWKMASSRVTLPSTRSS